MNESILLEAKKVLESWMLLYHKYANDNPSEDMLADRTSELIEAIKKWEDSSHVPNTGDIFKYDKEWNNSYLQFPPDSSGKETGMREFIIDVWSDGELFGERVERDGLTSQQVREARDEYIKNKSVHPYKEEETEEDIYDAVRQYRKDHPEK